MSRSHAARDGAAVLQNTQIQVGPTEDDFVICREGYVSAEGVLAHLDNVGDVLGQALEVSVFDYACMQALLL